MVHPTTITLAVDQLEQRQLVARSAHPTDRRTTVVRLTKAGHEVADRATEALAAANFGLSIPRDMAIELVELLRGLRREIGVSPPSSPD